MSSQVYIAGVGMIPFAKPGQSAPYHVMGAEAARLALADAGLDYSAVEQAYVGYVYGDSTCGQRALYQVGMSGIPIINVNNNCSTGSTALFMARQAIASGAADCVLALGFEQMKPGALGAVFTDRPSAFDDFDAAADSLVGEPEIPLALRYFGGAGLSHMKKYGTPLTSFAKVRAKASRHALNNPLALFRNEVTADDVMNDRVVWPGVMTRLMACPPTCGGAAALLVSDKFAARHGLRRDVRIAAQAMTTDTPSTFGAGDMMQVVGFDMTRAAANKVYEAAGIGPDDLDVVELHDCFAHNELITYEALGLCPDGGAAAVLVSEKFASKHGLRKDVRIAAQAMTTDTPSTFGASDMMQVVGYDMARDAARKVYEAAGIGPKDLDVVELHDCFAHNELITYEGLGLCGQGEAAKFIDDGDNTYGGRIVTNPSGGLLSKGHPLGATGLAQCYELTRQLRGTAAATQVDGARLGLQHNLGLGGACVVTLYERA